MVLTVQQVIIDAMTLIQAVAIDETPTTSELNLGLRTLNVMIDRWSSQRLLLRSTTPLSFALTANKYSYTIGASGCDVTSATKIVSIYSAYYTDMGNIDSPIDVIDITTYNNLGDKSAGTGSPMYIAYDPGSAQQATQKGTLYVYLNPDSAYTMHLECDGYFTEFSSLSDTITFEPAYYEALIYNLGVRLFRMFRDAATPVPGEMVAIANNSLNNLRTMNAVQIIAGMDLPGKISSYNIYVDGPG